MAGSTELDENRLGEKTAGDPGARHVTIGSDSSPPTSNYVSLSRLRVEPGRVEELVEAFRARAHLVDHADGFLDLEVWRSDRDPAEVIMVSRWRDRECFREYMRSESHEISHRRIAPALKDAIELERLEHVQTYDVVAR